MRLELSRLHGILEAVQGDGGSRGPSGGIVGDAAGNRGMDPVMEVT